MAGPVCRIDACAETGHRGALARRGRIWLVRLVPGDPLRVSWGMIPCRRSGSRRRPAVAGLSDTPLSVRGNRCSCRYGWSWPEPPAGAIPHDGRSGRALSKTGACGQLGITNGQSDGGPWSPSIRERACPARLRPARTATTAKEEWMDVFCGIDWAEDHHDIALVGQDGQLLGRCRISDDAAGLAQLLTLLAGHGDSAGDLIPVAIETPRGLLVACLRATGRKIYPVNPMAVARYRDRHSVAGGKSDHGDAVVLANVLRTDMGMHRPLPADTELAQAIAVLARAQQDAVWDRTQAHNKLRSHLREYYPGFLAAYHGARDGIMRPEARAVLAAAPTPAAAAKLTVTQLRGLLNKAGRRRGVDTEATRLRDAFRVPQMRQLPLVEDAMGRRAVALLGQLDAACVA